MITFVLIFNNLWNRFYHSEIININMVNNLFKNTTGYLNSEIYNLLLNCNFLDYERREDCIHFTTMFFLCVYPSIRRSAPILTCSTIILGIKMHLV